MQQGGDDAADRGLHLSAALRVERGQPGGQPGQLGLDDLVGAAAQRDHRRSDPGGSLPGQEVPDLLGDKRAHRFHVRSSLGRRELFLQRREVDQGNPRQVPHGNVNVARQGEVEDGQRSAIAGGDRTGDNVVLDDDPGRAGRGDDDIRLLQGPLEPVQADARAVQLVRQALGVVRRAVGDDDLAGAGATQGRAGQCAHRSRPDEEHAAALERPDRGDRTLQPDRDQRTAGTVDPGLAVRPLADPERGLEQLVQGRPGPVVTGRRVGLAQLPEDLRLADHHRVQPAGDLEQVQDRLPLPVHVEVALEVVQRHPRQSSQQVADRIDAGVEDLGVGVDLDPVARREHHDLADRAGRPQLGHHELRGPYPDSDLLQQGHRRALVRHTDDQDAHADTCPASGSSAMGPSTSDSAALRCS